MTYLKTTLIASALTAATASVAFAGEDMDKDYDMKDNVKIEKAMESKTIKSETKTWSENSMHPSKVNDTAGEILQADGEPSIQSDREYVTYDGKQKVHAVNPAAHDDIAKTAIAVPGSNNSITTVNCPEGTVARVDMTCMITGDFELTESTTISANTDVAGAVEYDWSNKEYKTDKLYEYDMDTEYKGTLRPDTVVVDNLED